MGLSIKRVGGEEKGGTEASPRRVKDKLKVKADEIEQFTDHIQETTVTIRTRTMRVPDQRDRLIALIFSLLSDFQPGR